MLHVSNLQMGFKYYLLEIFITVFLFESVFEPFGNVNINLIMCLECFFYFLNEEMYY